MSRLPLPLLLSAVLASGGCSSVSRQTQPAAIPTAPGPAATPLPARADRLVIEKSKRQLTAYSGKRPFLSYHVALGRNPVGAKTCSGDYRTPEGQYRVTGVNHTSRFYKSLRLSYPNRADIDRARRQGCNPGGNIVIHGLENGFGYVGSTHRQVDWTSGCIAITNQEMDQLLKLAPVGTRVEILP